MVDFDLRKLSAPIEALRSDVDAAYKRLDERWDAVAKALKALPIPCDVGYTFDEDVYHPENHVRLEWRKWKGKKRLCIVSCYVEMTPFGPEDAEIVTPYEEWGGEQRIDLLEHVPKLFEAAAEQTKAFVAKTEEPEDQP